MSSPNTPQPIIHVAELANKTIRLNSGEFRIGARRHKLICDNDGVLRQDFQSLIELSPEAQISLHYRSSSLLPRMKSQKVDTRHFFVNPVETPTQDLSVTLRDGIQVTLSCRAPATASTTQGIELLATTIETAEPSTIEATGPLVPTTEPILEDCPQFRILVIGKSGVGKSSLINTAFGINEASAADLKRGIANINQELVSPVNNRFILHDSLGFEPGDKDNYKTVKEFIQHRQTGELKDQLHAVWFCIQTPLAGGRLLEAAAEDFFQTKKDTLGTIPLIVVYTMFDSLVHEIAMRLAKSQGKLSVESLMKRARSKAESTVGELHDQITKLAKESLPYATVSTKEKYKSTLENLVELTHHQVRARVTPEAQIKSVVPLIAAQRVVADLKIQGTIDVGKQRYWIALMASPNFKGYKIWDCLSVIHADIVAIWNFNDPFHRLSDNKFKELVIEMVQEVQTPSVQQSNNVIALDGGSLLGIFSALLPIVSNPAAPIVIPVIVGLFVAAWLYEVYQNVKNVQCVFMAFIVDLTYILDTLFILTARDHNKLTRRAIKLSCKIYHDSGMMNLVHANIRDYRKLDGRDTTLEMIECLIRPERGGDSNMRSYRAEVGKLDIQKLNLDQEEEW